MMPNQQCKRILLCSICVEALPAGRSARKHTVTALQCCFALHEQQCSWGMQSSSAINAAAAKASGNGCSSSMLVHSNNITPQLQRQLQQLHAHNYVYVHCRFGTAVSTALAGCITVLKYKTYTVFHTPTGPEQLHLLLQLQMPHHGDTDMGLLVVTKLHALCVNKQLRTTVTLTWVG